MREIKCIVCGLTVEVPPRSRRKYCEVCARQVRAEAAREKEAARRRERKRAQNRPGGKRPAKSVKEINAEARAHGMSYGQWVAQMEARRNV